MSEDNLEIKRGKVAGHIALVRRDVAARDARDWTGLDEIWHPKIELEVAAGAGTYRGIDGITRFFDSISDLFSEFRVEAEEMVEVGERVVTIERVSGCGLKGSDAQSWVQEKLFRLITFKEGKIWRVKECPSRTEALAAAGLSAGRSPSQES